MHLLRLRGILPQLPEIGLSFRSMVLRHGDFYATVSPIVSIRGSVHLIPGLIFILLRLEWCDLTWLIICCTHLTAGGGGVNSLILTFSYVVTRDDNGTVEQRCIIRYIYF